MKVAPDVRLKHAVEGSGARNLVLLHELGGSLHSFDELVPLLADDFRILRYDQRGCGQSATPRGQYPFGEHVRDLENLFSAADVKPPVFMAGFAAGSAIAVSFALRHPKNVTALALCAPALAVDADRKVYLAERSALVAREGMGAVVEDTLARSYPPQFRNSEPARFETYRAHFLANDPAGYGYLNMAFADVALIESLGALDLPCLLVAGEHDPLRPPEQVKKLAARIKGTQVAVIDAGHIMAMHAPDELAGRLRAFFSSV